MINVINQFLETPFELEGKKASNLLSKKRRRRRRHQSPPEVEEDIVLENDEPSKKRKEKKKKEKEQYKSAQFIEDSDEEYGDMQAFLEKEETLRQKAALAGAEAASEVIRPSGMRAHGTKKRRQKKTTRSGPGAKERIRDRTNPQGSSSSSKESDDERSPSSEGEENNHDDISSAGAAQPSPATQLVLPRPSQKEIVRTAAEEDNTPLKSLASEDKDASLPGKRSEWQRRARKLVVPSDDEE